VSRDGSPAERGAPNRQVLFRVALALLSLNEERLLAFDNAGTAVCHIKTANI
jgi:hypothetical protein